MTREDLIIQAEELKKEEKYLDDRQHKLWDDTQKLENSFIETAIYKRGTIFSYLSSLVCLIEVQCKSSGYKSYKYELAYSFNLVNSNGVTTGMTILKGITESKLKEMISENKLTLYEDEVKVSTNSREWPKEIHPKYIKASRRIGEQNKINDFIIETEECENNRKKVKKYIKNLYRVQTTCEVQTKEWYVKPIVSTDKEGNIKEEFFIYRRYYSNGKRTKDRWAQTYVSRVNEDDLLETLLDFNN